MLRRALALAAFLASWASAVPMIPDELADASVGMQESARSRRTRMPEPVSPWYVSFGRDRRGSSASINYQLRWDFDDLKRSPETLIGHLRDPFGSVDFTLRQVAEETRIDLYGLHVKPFRGLFVEPLLASTTAAGAAAVAPPRRRRWYDIDPYVQELERSARRDARRFLIRTAFDSALPNARGAPLWQKEAVTTGLLDLGRTWSPDEGTVPLFGFFSETPSRDRHKPSPEEFPKINRKGGLSPARD